MRRVERGPGDRWLFLAVLLLLGLGSVSVFSSSTTISSDLSGSSTRMFLNHLTKIGLGLALLALLSRVDYRVLKRLVIPMIGASMGLLALTLVPDFPLAVTAKGATRWIDFGIMAIQPAEVAKLSLVIYVASLLSQGEGRIRDYKRGFVPVLTVLGIFVVFLVLQPNFGNVLTLGLLTAIMLFVGGARLMHMASSGMATMPLVAFVALNKRHVVSRIGTFLDPGADPQGAGFQLHQSLIAFGSGGLLGHGPGAGRQSEYFLPDCHTDFVFAVLGEEFGLLGTLAVVALFAVVVWRGLVIARSAKDLFGRHLAIGLTAMIGIVAFLNMAVALGLAPTAGLPLPFVSYGGSAMLVNLGGVGILLSIARRSQRSWRRTVVG
jgi:cell division protein FtsW